MKVNYNVIILLFFVLFTHLIFAQERTITGTVTDESNLPLPGVNVVIKGTNNGTQTDFDGKFKIITNQAQRLVFSFIGMKDLEVAASSTNLKIKMKDDSIQLEGVVVTAFGIKRNQKKIGYSISSVGASEITENSEPDLVKSLSGKIAGVNINISTGVAGAANQMTIRGINTFSGNSQPLIIVDGITYSNISVTTSSQTTGGGGYESALSSLDPNDIEKIDVLKSAAASALYGSRAVNGVIVITTKSGSSGGKKNNKINVTIGTSTYFENIANLPDYQNTYGAGSTGIYGPQSNGSWGPKFGTVGSSGISTDGTVAIWPAYQSSFPELGNKVLYQAHPNNVKDLFKTGVVYDNTLGINYSGDQGSFNTTISDLNQEGYIPFNTYTRTSISVGGNFKSKNGFSYGANMSYSKTNQIGAFFGENQFDGAASSFARTLYLGRNWDLNLPFEDPVTKKPVGPNADQFDNPLWSWKHDQINTETTRTVAGINLGYKFNDNISTTYRFGYNLYNLDRNQIRDLGSRADSGLGSLTYDGFKNEDIESTLLFNFNYELNKNFGLTAILGSNILQTNTSRIGFSGKQFILPEIFNLRNVKNVSNSKDENTKYRNAGMFADLSLSYKNFLFINGTARNDFSSTLPKDNNSYFYSSISGSLLLTDAFNINSSALTLAKIRGGYAKVGKDAPAEFLNSTYKIGNTYNGQPVISNNTFLSDHKIQPEFTTEYEIGTDLEFYKRRIALELSLYKKTTSNLITDVTVPVSSGFETYRTNVGEMENKGIEIALTLVPLRSENFKWTLLTTYTNNNNKVISIAEGIDRSQIDPNFVGYLIPGEAFGTFYGTKFARDSNGAFLINPSTGGILADKNLGIIGNPNADFKMSFTNTFKYKGFSLRTQFDWKQGGDVSSTTIQSLLGRGVTKDTENRENTYIIPGFYGNSDGTPTLDTNGNQIANTTQLTMNELYFSSGGTSNTFAINTVDEANIYDGTVFRLREVNLTYGVPSTYLKKTYINSLSFSIVGSNLWYFAPNVPKYTNFDPEVTSFGSSNLQGIEVTAAPTAKRYGFKINITF